MSDALKLEKYSFGVGDRFAHQAKAQLRACMRAAAEGVEVAPVWNKSYREHSIVGSQPASVLAAAQAAVSELDWTKPYHLDADHIRLETVESFIEPCDFYTLDVADAIGQPAAAEDVKAFVERHPELVGRIEIPGIEQPFETDRAEIERIANKFLAAVQEAGRLYRHIPAKNVAPKFTGRFNKGVDYVGDVVQFEKEFNEDLAVIAHAVKRYGLPDNLKLSVHSGSDKFSIYEPIRRALQRTGAGIHVKTAGTNWLEELIGLAESGGEGLKMAKEIYGKALDDIDALSAPYATVIDIDRAKLPSKEEVNGWSSDEFVSALRHDPANPRYNLHLRQLLHVGFKVAAKMGERYLDMLKACEATVSKNVTENLYERHMKPLFIGNGVGS